MAELSIPDEQLLSSPGLSGAGDDGGAGGPVIEAPTPAAALTTPAALAPDPTRDLAGALHEVSNALTVVLGWIERARTAAGSPADVERALDVAAARAADARTIVRRAIGAEARAEADGTVDAVIADALTGVDPELRRAGLHAEVAVAPAASALRIPSAASVLQILTNLLLNASALAPRSSVVHLEASPTASGVLFAVTDAGPGVSPERRATIFHAGVSTRPGGAGVGLRHAAALARSRGGELSLAESREGARFELRWPLLPAAPAVDAGLASRVAHRSGKVAPLAGTRILLVEDDDAVVDLLDTALTARGADVVSVRKRSELADALATGRFDAALFDISPIADDVRGAVASVRGADGTARVVMISGTAVALPALPAGWISAWVRKPFEIGEILQALEPAGTH